MTRRGTNLVRSLRRTTGRRQGVLAALLVAGCLLIPAAAGASGQASAEPAGAAHGSSAPGGTGGVETAAARLLGRAGIVVPAEDGVRQLRPEGSHVGADFAAALERFHGLLRRPVPSRGEGSGPSLAEQGRRDELVDAYESLRAADLLVRERFDLVRRRLEAVGAPESAVARLDAAEERYGTARASVLEPLEEPMAELDRSAAAGGSPSAAARIRARAALATARAWLDEHRASSSPPVLRSELPVRSAELAARLPETEPVLVPSYLDPTDPPSLPADLAGSLEAPLSEAIVAQARDLGFDAVRVYEFVHNEIATEVYAGGLKGAEETLRQGAGNDVDQASLLIALYRASSIPARYVHGVVELPVEQVAETLGLDDPAAVPTALARAGVAHRPVIRGGRVAAVEVEHTWVTAHVPYSNYRGAVVDFSGRTWLPLAPAIKRVDRTAPTGVLRAMDLSVDDAIAGRLAGPQQELPMAWLRRQVEQYLAVESPGATYEDQLGSVAVRSEEVGLLPSTLTVPVVAVTGETATLGDERRQRVRFVVRSGLGEDAPAILDVTLPVAEVAGRRLTLSYQPATVDDHRTVDAFGGLDRVPVYLVDLRPQIKVDGRLRATGLQPIAMGTAHRVEVRVEGPWGSEQVASTLVAGSYQAIAVGAQRYLPRDDPGGEPADSEGTAARLLSQVANEYGAAWDAAEDELAGLLACGLVRPVPSVVFAADAVRVESVLDLPVELAWQGVTLDAALRVAEPLASASDPAAKRDFYRISALQGSALEHQVFEDDFLVDSISADKGLGLARAAGIPVETVDSTNVDSVLPTLEHPASVLADIDNRVRLGQTVEVPRTAVSFDAWTGAVWRAEDPETGAAAYLIAGGLAGGATAQAPSNWVLDFLADALADPYSSEPDADPLSAVAIFKIPGTDGQEGVVGKVLPDALSVLVLDALGRPVQGAPVTFSVSSGDGLLLADDGSGVVVRTATTDRLGRASARLRLGTDTSLDPVYMERQLGDENLSRALANLVEATVASRGGTRVLGQPFEAFAFPGEPVVLRRTDTGQTVFPVTRVALWADTIFVGAEDKYGNPVSNVEVQFEALPLEVASEYCSEPPVDPLPPALFVPSECPEPVPVLGDCGTTTLTRRTSIHGVAAGVILGDAIPVTYRIRVSAPDLTPLEFSYPVSFTVAGGGECTSAKLFTFQTSQITDGEGHVIQAARPGGLFPRPIEIALYYWKPDSVAKFVPADGNTGEHWVLDVRPQGKWVRTTGDVEFQVSAGGSALPAPSTELGSYKADVLVGFAPARNEVSFQATHILTKVDLINPETGLVFSNTVYFDGLYGDHVTDVWGVEPQVVSIEPDPIALTDAGTADSPVRVQYQVSPAQYVARDIELRSYADNEWVGRTVASGRSGSGEVTQQRGLVYDPERHHTVELVLNPGTVTEVRSGYYDLPLYQRLFRNVSSSVFVSQDVDVVNDRVCSQPDRFTFGLNRQAQVTLTVHGVIRHPDGSSEQDGSEIQLISNQTYDQGEHGVDVLPVDLPPGEYEYELRGVAAADGAVEVRRGFVRSSYRERNALPVGHVLVEGVDLFDGHLVLQRQDLSVPGRGVALDLSRAYASTAGGDPGPLGLGWTHSYDSKLFVTPCGEVVISGGDGSGARFVDDGNGGLRPLAGQHGTLVANAEDQTFDYFSKSGNHYHYRQGRGSEWVLDRIEDPNGNTTRLDYEASPVDPETLRLVSVEDPAGRRLRFTWESRTFYQWDGDVITRVEGPAGLSISYFYDGWGNLVRAEREPHEDGSPSRVESYDYELQPDNAYDDRHVLVAVHDEVGGGETDYTWEKGALGLQGSVQVPRAFVTSVTRPEGGSSQFSYTLADLAAREPESTAVVTDPRGEETSYVLNRYGSPLTITDPLGHTETMEWAPDDIVVTARTDGRGVRTESTYDDDANLLTESVDVTDFDGTAHTYVRRFTYAPESAFSVPGIKNRVATATDRNGDVTTFTYDGRGNRLSEVVEGTDHEVHSTYLPNGDRAATTDPRGYVTTFGYDAYGNLVKTTDPLGGVASAEWDVRGRPVNRTDALGRVTRIEYDTLDRPVRRVLPQVDGEPAPPEETLEYRDADRQLVATDAAGRVTTTDFDLEGRTVRIENPESAVKELEYDPAGNKTLESSWFDASTPRFDTTYTYDAAGRLSRTDEPLGKTTEVAYDEVGNVTRQTLTDRAAPGFAPRETLYAYDALNRRIRTERQLESTSAVTRVRYDGVGNAVLSVDPLGRETRTTYDPLHRVTRIEEPEWQEGEPKVTRFAYDPSGNRTEQVRENVPQDQVRRSEYDALNRLVSQTDAEGAETVFEYDAVGNRVRTIDPLLNVRSFVYDARNRLIAERSHLDRVTEPATVVETGSSYDAVGNRTEERWPNGDVVTHSYDGLNRLTATADSLGPMMTASYDARGNRVRETDANGNVTERDVDALDRVVEERLPEGRTVSTEWDVAGNRVATTDANGNRRTFRYDRLNRLVETTDPAPFGYTTGRTYDLVGNRLTETDRRGNTWTYEYDALNRRVTATDPAPLGYTVTSTYDAVGNRLTETDRRGIVTATRYDRENRPVEVKRSGVVISSTEYDAAGNRRFVTDADGNITGYEYDERNLVTAEDRPLAAITRYRMDEMGDRVQSTDPEGRVSHFTYDARRRLVSETDGAGQTTAYEFDGNGNRTLLRRPEGQEWLYRYDGADRLSEVENPLGEVTAYTYDSNGNRLTTTDANGHETSFSYDALDRLASKTYPAVGGVSASETYEYDANGNLTSTTDPKAQTTTREYDALDRETLRSYPAPTTPTGDDLESIGTVYDPNNNPTHHVETYGGPTGARETVETYDAFDRLLTMTDPEGKALTYTYDANGNRTSVTDPDGTTTVYGFDALNRTETVTQSGVGVTEYAWYKDSRQRRVTYPNGTQATTTYDQAGRVATIENRQGAAAVVSSYSYAYDGNGNRTEQVETNGGPAESTTYAYDDADRLQEAAYPDRTVTYTYDAVGNRKTERITDPADTPLGDRTYTYDARDRLQSITDGVDAAFATTFTYDANGNQTSRTRAGETTELLYDARDRLQELHRGTDLLETYRYDYQGLRIKKSGPDGVRRYVYDDQSVLLETDDFGNTLAKYDYGADRLLSLAHATEGRQYYLFDALGSVVTLTTPAGAVQERTKYDAWGNLRQTVGSSENPFRFTGYQYDAATGLYYAKARYYDPELGIFLTEDPFEGQLDTPPSLHRYLYAYQNPTVFRDPTGRQNVFTPDEVLQDSIELQRLQRQLVDARLAAKKAFEGAGKTSDPEELRRALSRPLEIQSRIGALQERLGKAEQFYGEVVMVIEDAESVDAQREILVKFLLEKKHVGFERAVRVTTALLGPSECDVYCQRIPNSTDEEIQLFRSMESFAANTALFGLFELGVLEYVDDAVRVTALVDDAAVLEDGAVRTAASLDDVASLGDDLGRGARRTPSSGPLKNASGDLDEAANAARRQPHGSSGGAVLPTPKVSNKKLQNIVDDLYKGTTNPFRVGTGTTADAVRTEIRTGQPTLGTFHLDKARQYSQALKNWLARNPDAPFRDRLVAQSLLDDLQDALGTKP